MTVPSPLYRAALATLFSGIFYCGIVASQNYEFKMGYIFDQPFVTRLSVSDQKKLIGTKIVIPFDASNDAAKIKVQQNVVSRNGENLTIKLVDKPPVVLRDFNSPATNDVEGDSQIFRYDRLIPNAIAHDAYHKVDVFFGHDRPYALLINAKSGKMYFVGSD